MSWGSVKTTVWSIIGFMDFFFKSRYGDVNIFQETCQALFIVVRSFYSLVNSRELELQHKKLV